MGKNDGESFQKEDTWMDDFYKGFRCMSERLFAGRKDRRMWRIVAGKNKAGF